MNDPAASGQPGAGPNIDVRPAWGLDPVFACDELPGETLHGVSNPPLRLGVHGVSKLALREGVDPNRNNFRRQQTLSRRNQFLPVAPTASSGV